MKSLYTEVSRRELGLAVGAVALIGTTSFLLSPKPVPPLSALFRNGETRYAEVATTTPTLSPAATSTVPIVVYHIVRPAYPDDSDAVKGLAHTPEVFDAQMRYLSEAGYHVVSMRALASHVRNGTALPDNPLVITFDDGWRDQFEYAFPILEKYHYTATFFVFTNPIGTRGFLTWEDLATLRDAGMTIGSHSLSHPFLTTLTDSEKLWREIEVSKKRLERNLHIHVTEFAYPFGYYNPEIVALVARAGYTSARGDVSKEEQTANDLYTLGALNAPVSLAGFMRAFPKR